jgi:hypothetical protein
MLNLLTVEEVVERIKTANSEASAAVAATSPRLRPESKPHRPEFYVPKLNQAPTKPLGPARPFSLAGPRPAFAKYTDKWAVYHGERDAELERGFVLERASSP